jgi:DNA-binding HxlR family transcriptional regulator
MKHEDTTASDPKGHNDHARCRILVQILDRIANKWTVMIVSSLAEGPVRFNALQRDVEGISHRMLTLTLRGLESDGLVTRTVYPTVPPKVEYELTNIGQSLILPLKTLLEWAESNQIVIGKKKATNDKDIFTDT